MSSSRVSPGSSRPGAQWIGRMASSSPSGDEKSDREQSSEAKERRREQVRRAQRTHRDRKATYVKALEMEVAKLRAKDAQSSEELRQAWSIIYNLQDLLMQHGIFVPPEVMEINHPMATIEMVGHGPFNKSLRASMPNFDHSAPAPHVRSATPAQTQSSTDTRPTLTTAIPQSSAMAEALAQRTTAAPSTHPYGLDTTQVGVNFVLYLEKGCLLHHGIPSVPMLAHGDLGVGHSLMLSSPIMEHSPHYSLNPLKMGWPRGATWQVPSIELEKLLSFSDQIELEGEITPVQVWHAVITHPSFVKMTPERLEVMRNILEANVKCLGFGAVIEQSFFEKVFQETIREL